MNGRDYIVAPLTLIVPGVLNGSKGALYYPPEEVSRDPDVWNGVPIVVYHPTRNGVHVSARDPDVLDKQGIGMVLRSKAGGKLTAEGWFDVEATRRVDNRVLQALEAGSRMELSTGLFTENEPARGTFNGKPYDAIARNYKPDHLAILPDQVGACSVNDGCGVMVNQWFEINCGGPGGKPGPCPTMAHSDAGGGKSRQQLQRRAERFSKNAEAVGKHADKVGDRYSNNGAYIQHSKAAQAHKEAGNLPKADYHTKKAQEYKDRYDNYSSKPTTKLSSDGWPLANSVANCSCGGACDACTTANKKKLPSAASGVTPDKACKILKDGTAQGHPLTEAQRGMFGAVCGKRGKKKVRNMVANSSPGWTEVGNCGCEAMPMMAGGDTDDGSYMAMDFAVRQAFRQMHPDRYDPDTGAMLPRPHVVAVFEDYLIARAGSELFRLAWALGEDGQVEIGDGVEQVRKEVEYVPVDLQEPDEDELETNAAWQLVENWCNKYGGTTCKKIGKGDIAIRARKGMKKAAKEQAAEDAEKRRLEKLLKTSLAKKKKQTGRKVSTIKGTL